MNKSRIDILKNIKNDNRKGKGSTRRSESLEVKYLKFMLVNNTIIKLITEIILEFIK